MGDEAASSPRVSAERNCHVSPWEAPLQPPRLGLPLPQRDPKKSKLLLRRFDAVGMWSRTSLILSLSLKQRATLTKQASVHQAKVSSWLHSSEDMNKCCKGWSLFCLFLFAHCSGLARLPARLTVSLSDCSESFFRFPKLSSDNKYLSLRLGGMWIVHARAQPAAEEHGGPPPHVLGPGH